MLLIATRLALHWQRLCWTSLFPPETVVEVTKRKMGE